jgi:hypothetical protein
MIQGTVKGTAPAPPVILTAEEREKLHLKEGGFTLFYPAGEAGVFFHANGNEFLVWFAGDDCDKVTEALHSKIRSDFPETRQLEEVRHPTEPSMRARAYHIELGGGRIADIETSFAQAKTGQHTFSARVIAQRRMN